MHIDVDQSRIDGKRENGKRVSVQHEKAPVGFLDRFGDDTAAYISLINKIILKIPVAAVDIRFSYEAVHGNAVSFGVNFDQIGCDLSSVNAVDHIPETVVARCMQLCLAVADKFE